MKYVTNFSADSAVRHSNLYDTKIKNKRKMYIKKSCRHFILFVYFLKNIFSNHNISIFVKPKKINIFNILRAPYKNKISKHQMTLSRFYLNVSLKIKLNDFIHFNNTNSVTNIVNFLKSFYSFFESNICFQHKSNMYFHFYLNNYFFI